MMEIKKDAVEGNIAEKPECLLHESRQIGSGQTGDGKSERLHFRNQLTKTDSNG